MASSRDVDEKPMEPARRRLCSARFKASVAVIDVGLAELAAARVMRDAERIGGVGLVAPAPTSPRAHVWFPGTPPAAPASATPDAATATTSQPRGTEWEADLVFKKSP